MVVSKWSRPELCGLPSPYLYLVPAKDGREWKWLPYHLPCLHFHPGLPIQPSGWLFDRLPGRPVSLEHPQPELQKEAMPEGVLQVALHIRWIQI